MLAEDAYLVHPMLVHITKRKGHRKSVVFPHVVAMDGLEYHKAGPVEVRYVIRRPMGIASASLYLFPIGNYCPQAQSHLTTTAKLDGVDGVYFELEADAKEVRNNIGLFIKWLKMLKKTRRYDKDSIAIVDKHRDLIRDAEFSPIELELIQKHKDECSKFTNKECWFG